MSKSLRKQVDFLPSPLPATRVQISTTLRSCWCFCKGSARTLRCVRSLPALKHFQAQPKERIFLLAVERVAEKNNLKWENMKGITTNGAPAMVGISIRSHYTGVRESPSVWGADFKIPLHFTPRAVVCQINRPEECDVIREFQARKKSNLQVPSDKQWIADLAFLVDITELLNTLNLQLQGKDQVISRMYDRVRAFKQKLLLLNRHLSTGEA